MKRKRVPWTTVIFIAVLLLFVGFFANIIMAFYGNPITAAIATNKIRHYVRDTYPDMDLEIPKATFNFKFDEYFSQVKSKVSQDTHFSVYWSKGKIIDSYEEYVIKRRNTYDRLNREFSNQVEEIIKQEFPYDTSMLFADLGKEETDFGELSLDMQLDITKPPLPAELVIYILSDEINYDFFVARLRELSQLMEKHKIPIDLYTVVIEEPLIKGEEKPAPNGETIYLYDFPAEKLGQADLLATIKEHQMTWEAQHQK